MVLSRFTSLASFLSFFATTLLSATTDAYTAVVFGATGTVGNEVLRAVVHDTTFTKVIVVGRRDFPAKVKDLLPETAVQIVQKDLATIDEHQELAEMQADACFVATASGFPHLSDMHNWYHSDVVVTESIVKLCGKMHAKVITAFTTLDSGLPADDYTPKELAPTGEPMGWWPVMTDTIRMMQVKDATISKASIPSIRIFQPSSIVTKETRYGWLDWTVFKFHGAFDEWLPTPYHSVTNEFLGQAMAKDSANVLLGKADYSKVDDEGVARLQYAHFLEIMEGANGDETATEL